MPALAADLIGRQVGDCHGYSCNAGNFTIEVEEVLDAGRALGLHILVPQRARFHQAFITLLERRDEDAQRQAGVGGYEAYLAVVPDSCVFRAATSARFSCDGFGACGAALWTRRRRIGDRIREGFGETVVAPIVHMQPVRRKE
jgi:hypothetical protein